MQVKDINMGKVEFTECRTQRDILPSVPRPVPNVIMLSIHDIHVTIDMEYISGGAGCALA
jgi:hypothetical protein